MMFPSVSFLSFLPAHFQHDPLGLFLVLSATSVAIGVVVIFALSKILP